MKEVQQVDVPGYSGSKSLTFTESYSVKAKSSKKSDSNEKGIKSLSS